MSSDRLTFPPDRYKVARVQHVDHRSGVMMLRVRKLVLRKETLSALAPEALRSVAGGGVVYTFYCTRQVDCINDISFEICPTMPLEECTKTDLR